jgi:hypothetical protein
MMTNRFLRLLFAGLLLCAQVSAAPSKSRGHASMTKAARGQMHRRRRHDRRGRDGGTESFRRAMALTDAAMKARQVPVDPPTTTTAASIDGARVYVPCEAEWEFAGPAGYKDSN